jgi:hypothetical protein
MRWGTSNRDMFQQKAATTKTKAKGALRKEALDSAQMVSSAETAVSGPSPRRSDGRVSTLTS